MGRDFAAHGRAPSLRVVTPRRRHTRRMSERALPLWEGPAPGSERWVFEEQWTDLPEPIGGRVLRNVIEPTLTPYLPDEVPPRQAVVVAPGGGLHFLAMDNEGAAVARWLRERGVAAYVLKYRLVPTATDDAAFGDDLRANFADGDPAIRVKALDLATADAGRAIEVLRSSGVQHVAYLGFSAGARIGAELVLRAPRERRPDLAALIYLYAVQHAVAPDDGVPLFLLAAADDPLGISGSLDLHAAWRAAGHPVEQHLFERGGHGFGMTRSGLPVDAWPDLFLAWLRSHLG